MKPTRRTSWFILLIGLLLAETASILGATLENYRERLDRARNYAYELAEIVGEDEAARERKIVADIRTTVPRTEKVAGGSLETDNQWLHALLDEFGGEKDDEDKRAIMYAIADRLAGLTASIRELETAVAASRSKDEDKQKLAEILRRAEYQKPEPEDESLFQKWWRAINQWLSDMWPRPNLSPGTGLDLSGVGLALQILIFGLVIALIGFIVWRLAPFLSARFGGRVKKKREERIILGERIGADESAADLFGEAEALARAGNLRGAIRKGYIAMLCELGDRKVVRLARHKTNRDYLRDVRNVEGIFHNMSGLTHNFERTWYGLRVPEERDWDEFRAMYQQTLSTSTRAPQ